MPQISIIVPVYKAEKYIHRCIGSILRQTFSDFELILVDDGSPDGSGAICDDYAAKDRRVRVIHQENKGASAARNAGLDAAAGDWIAFCDSDDMVAPKWLEHLVEKAVPGVRPVSAFCANAEDLGCEKPLAEIGTEVHPSRDFYLMGRYGLTGYLWNTLFESVVIRANGLRLRTQQDKGDYNEDLLFCLQYQRYMTGIVYTGYADYLYDAREGSLSRSHSAYYFDKYEEKYLLVRQFLESHGLFDQKKLLADSMLYRYLTALNHADYPQVRRILASEAVQETIRLADGSMENPAILRLIEKKAALLLWLRLRIYHLKNHGFAKKTQGNSL